MSVEEIQSTEIPSVPSSMEDMARWAEDFARDHFDDLKKLDTILSLVSGGFIEIPADPTVPGADGNWRWYNDGTDLTLQRKIDDIWTDTAIKMLSTGELITLAGRIVKTIRIDSGDSPYTVLDSDHEIFCDTDGGAIIVNLLAGIDGRTHIIKNVGTSGNIVTLSPDGSDLLFGENSDYIILDRGDDEQITYETTEGWG
jgi:hypothetical protein